MELLYLGTVLLVIKTSLERIVSVCFVASWTAPEFARRSRLMFQVFHPPLVNGMKMIGSVKF